MTRVVGAVWEGRHYPNVGLTCTRCQYDIVEGEKSERFIRKGGGLLARHVGECPQKHRPSVYRRRERERYEERRARQREREERIRSLRVSIDDMAAALNNVSYTTTATATPTFRWFAT